MCNYTTSTSLSLLAILKCLLLSHLFPHHIPLPLFLHRFVRCPILPFHPLRLLPPAVPGTFRMCDGSHVPSRPPSTPTARFSCPALSQARQLSTALPVAHALARVSRRLAMPLPCEASPAGLQVADCIPIVSDLTVLYESSRECTVSRLCAVYMYRTFFPWFAFACAYATLRDGSRSPRWGWRGVARSGVVYRAVLSCTVPVLTREASEVGEACSR